MVWACTSPRRGIDRLETKPHGGARVVEAATTVGRRAALPPVAERPLAFWFTCFVSFGLLSVVLWFRTLNSFLAYDDNNLIYWATARHPAFLADLLPLESGFWRPVPLMLTRVLRLVFGCNPVPYHIVSLLLHTINALLCVGLARRLGLPRVYAGAAGFLFLGHAGACFTVARFQDCGDLTMTSFGLAGLICFDRFLEAPGMDRWAAWGAAVCAVLAMASKETGVAVFGAFCVLFLLRIRGEWRNRRVWPALAMVAVIFCGFFAWGLLRQATSRLSYANAGTMYVGKHCVRLFLDYSVSLFWPSLYIAPLTDRVFPNAVLWMIRIATGVIGTGFLITATRVRAWRDVALVSCIACIIAVPSLINAGPQYRYLYAALPFTACLFASIFDRLVHSRLGVVIATAVFLLLSLPAFYCSRPLLQYLDHTRQLESITRQLKLLSPSIPADSTIAVINHPYGSKSQWPFGHFWMQVQFPDKHWQFAAFGSQSIGPDAQRVFTWRDGKLMAH